MVCDQMCVLLLFPVFLGNFTTVIDFVPWSFDFLEPTAGDYKRLYKYKFLH